jgi:undecaprenyl-diphosphatase
MDEELLRAVNQGMANPQMDAVMVVFSLLGMTLIWLVWAIPLWLKNKKRTALELLIVIIIIDLVVLLVKLLVARERPTDVRLVAPLALDFSMSEYSFPSGHAARAFGAFLVLSLSFRKKLLIAPLFVYAFLIALSRIYLGAHYPSDVLAGAFLGLGLAYAFYRASRTTVLKSYIDRIIRGIERVTSSIIR